MRRFVQLSYDLLATATIVVVAVLFNQQAIFHGQLYAERDTRVFYFPLHVWFADRLKQFTLPLWSPDFFGGFPIFADGETGMFYPPHVILSFFLPSDEAFVWNIVLHFVFAGTFTYCLARALGLTRLAGVLGGVSFMLCGFLVAQIHHQNLLNSAVWLPLILCFIERAARATGGQRHMNLAFAGVAFGFQCLGVHVQAPLMSSLVIGLFTVYRWLLCPVAGGKPRLFVRHDAWQQGWWRRPLLEALDRLFAAARVVFGRLFLTGWTLAIIPLLAGSLAAVQLLPLWELGTFSRRAGGVNYEFATMHPQTMANLLTLIFPNFFVGPDGFYWGLWSSWETRLYVGIAPLVLAVIGLIAARQRLAYFFGGLAVLSLWIGMASEAPFFNLHAWLSQFPGFNQMRAPGRYALVFSLCVAVLAAYGFSFLETHLRSRWAFRVGPIRFGALGGARRGWLPPLIAALALLIVAAIELTLRVEELWPQLQARDPAVTQWVDSYLAAPRMLRLGAERLTDDRVYAGLLESLNPAGFDVTYTLALLFVGVGLIYLWLALPALRRVFQVALIALVVADLTFINWQFHPLTPVSTLLSPSPPVRFLQHQQETAPGRVFTRPGAKTAPNSLMTHSLPEINGYSSLNFKAHEELTGAVDVGYGHLLDMFGARYLVSTNRFVPLPSYEATPFNPSRPIISNNSALNGAASDSFTFAPWEASEIRIISRLRDSAQLPQGTPVIELAATDDRNQTTTFRLLAGVHTAETKLHDPATRAVAQHRSAEIAFEYKNTAGVVEGYGYYARFPLRRGSRITQITVRNISPLGNVQVTGITLLLEPGPVFKRLLAEDSDRYKRVFEDTDVVIHENTRVLPRAYLVPNAYIPVQNTRGIYLVNFMAEGPFDPRREVVFEHRDAPPIARAQQDGTRRSADPTGSIVWEDSREMAIRLRVTSGIEQYLVLADTYYPGWRARINGVETPIYRANYLFRGIVVPPGEHVVEFTYEPPMFWLGFQITLGAAVGMIAIWALWRLSVVTLLIGQIARGWHRRGGRWRTLPLPPPIRRRVPRLRPQWSDSAA